MTEAVQTRDTLFGGALHCLQYRDGYRFSIDPVLLAHFVRLNTNEHILDLGAGCGVIGLILLYRASSSISSLTAFELQERLAGLVRENIVLNQFQNQMEVVEGDLRNITQYFNPESFSTILCNPPFYTPGSGRQSKNKEAEIARHQVYCSLLEIVSAAAVTVKNRGKVLMVYPANGLATLLLLLEQQRLRVKRMQLVYSYPGSSTGARLVLIEAVKNGGEGVDIMEPFYIYDKKDGDYTEEMQQFYAPN
ncbi:MAG: methyltransferase [Desulfocapsa sp.]|nr:methyltransferase [Desulfocapsa sp.]